MHCPGGGGHSSALGCVASLSPPKLFQSFSARGCWLSDSGDAPTGSREPFAAGTPIRPAQHVPLRGCALLCKLWATAVAAGSAASATCDPVPSTPCSCPRRVAASSRVSIQRGGGRFPAGTGALEGGAGRAGWGACQGQAAGSPQMAGRVQAWARAIACGQQTPAPRESAGRVTGLPRQRSRTAPHPAGAARLLPGTWAIG